MFICYEFLLHNLLWLLINNFVNAFEFVLCPSECVYNIPLIFTIHHKYSSLLSTPFSHSNEYKNIFSYVRVVQNRIEQLNASEIHSHKLPELKSWGHPWANISLRSDCDIWNSNIAISTRTEFSRCNWLGQSQEQMWHSPEIISKVIWAENISSSIVQSRKIILAIGHPYLLEVMHLGWMVDLEPPCCEFNYFIITIIYQ